MNDINDNSSIVDTQDFVKDTQDKPEIKLSEITDEYVLIDLDRLYYKSNSNFEETKKLSNLRVIKYSNLENLMKIAPQVEYGKSCDSQKNVLNILITEINKYDNTPDDSSYMVLIEAMHSFIVNFEVEEEYDTLDTVGISFDNTRQYICDPKTHLLLNTKDVEIKGKQFYCQFNENEITEIRHMLNDTDYNRYQYILKMFSETLAFKSKRAYSKISNIMSVVLFYLALLRQSNPLENYSAHDLFAHYMGLMFDILIRSLHFNVWFESPFCKHYMSKLKAGQDEILLNLCKRLTSRERFNYFVSNIDNPIIRSISFDEYENILKSIEVNVHGDIYYNFGITYITNLLTLPATMEAFRLSQANNTQSNLMIQNK